MRSSWQGTWFDCFVFCLHPEVFSDSAYVIVPYIFVILQIVTYIFFARHFLKKRWELGGLYYLEVALVFLMFSFQLVPSQKSAIFWWVGSVHYAMPMCMALLGIILGDKFLSDHKVKDLVLLSIVAALIGGATYPAALLLPEMVFILWLERAVIVKERNRKDLLLLIPLILEAVGLYFSFVAPGNAVRSAADISIGAKPTGGPVATILASITFSVKDAYETFIVGKVFILIAVLLIAVISAGALKAAKATYKKGFEKRFSHPLLFTVTAFLVNASMYAPRLYAGGEVSSGYYNFNFWVFFICFVAVVVYVMGFFISHLDTANKGKNTAGKLVTYAVLALAMVLIAYFGRHGMKEYTDYVCLEYYLSGQADDYRQQMALQRTLMEEEGVEDVIVPETNDNQDPLMHMPIVSDPENINNTMAAGFYGKNSCRSIPRQEWIELYGEKYGVQSTD